MFLDKKKFASLHLRVEFKLNFSKELEGKMREAETDGHEGKRKTETLWPIFKIHHQKSRYIFDLFYRRKAISRELYDYCIK